MNHQKQLRRAVKRARHDSDDYWKKNGWVVAAVTLLIKARDIPASDAIRASDVSDAMRVIAHESVNLGIDRLAVCSEPTSS